VISIKKIKTKRDVGFCEARNLILDWFLTNRLLKFDHRTFFHDSCFKKFLLWEDKSYFYFVLQNVNTFSKLWLFHEQLNLIIKFQMKTSNKIPQNKGAKSY